MSSNFDNEEIELWNLSHILFDRFDNFENMEHQRKQLLSQFLRELKYDESDENLEIKDKDIFEEICLLLSSNLVNEAVEIATKKGLHRLATIVCQAGSDSTFQESCKNQLNEWKNESSFKKLFSLLSGDVECLNPSNWRKAFSLFFWYKFADRSIAEIIQEYEKSVAEGKSPSPVVHGEVDILFRLLKYYAGSFNSETSVNVESVTNGFDVRIEWLLRTCLGNSDLITFEFGTELAECGLSDWAVFVMKTIDSESLSNEGIDQILSRYPDSLKDTDFLLNDLRLSPEQVFSHKALHEKAQGNELGYAECLLKSSSYSECMKLVAESVGPDCVLSGNLEFLQTMLEGLRATASWSKVGDMFLHFISASKLFPELLEQLSQGNTSHIGEFQHSIEQVSRVLESMPTKKDLKYKVFLAEISSQIGYMVQELSRYFQFDDLCLPLPQDQRIVAIRNQCYAYFENYTK